MAEIIQAPRSGPHDVVLSRGAFCPNDRRQNEELFQPHREMEVGYCQLVTVSTDCRADERIYAPLEISRTPEMKAALALSEKLISELQAADHLLISTPMYNFSVPALLKSWFDYIVRPGFTFKLAESWPGMLNDKPTTLIVVSRDFYKQVTPSEDSDLVSPVLRRVLRFMGISDVEVVRAGGSLGVNKGVVKLEDHLAKYEPAIAQAAAASLGK